MSKPTWTSRAARQSRVTKGASASEETRQRVERRRELASRPYAPRRRDFTPTSHKALNIARALGKVPVWRML
jgi:hypothetical protein